MVVVYGEHGEQLIINNISEFNENILPDNITTLTFESAFAFKNFFGVDQRNRVKEILMNVRGLIQSQH